MPDTLLPLFGLCAALLASLVGSFSGGGMSFILFPLLLLGAPGSYVSLLTTSKTSAAIMCLTAAAVHRTRHRFSLPLFSTLVISTVAGTAVGTYLVQYQFNETLFRTLIAIVMIVTGCTLLLYPQRGTENQPQPVTPAVLTQLSLFCLAISILNGLFGGTGIFTTFYLVTRLRFSFIQATAYTLSAYTVVNLLHSGYLLTTESVHWPLTLAVVLGSLAGSWLGTHLQYLKGNVWVRRATIAMMLVIGIRMLFG